MGLFLIFKSNIKLEGGSYWAQMFNGMKVEWPVGGGVSWDVDGVSVTAKNQVGGGDGRGEGKGTGGGSRVWELCIKINFTTELL